MDFRLLVGNIIDYYSQKSYFYFSGLPFIIMLCNYTQVWIYTYILLSSTPKNVVLREHWKDHIRFKSCQHARLHGLTMLLKESNTIIATHISPGNICTVAKS